MGSKRDSSEGPNGDLLARSASVKSTRISEANVEMFSPSGGALAELAAVPGLTPATSLAPLSAEPPATAAKRSRAGARSVPPSLTLTEGSPARQGRALPDVSVSPGQPAFEARMLLAFDELQQKSHQLAFNADEERAVDRTRIARL